MMLPIKPLSCNAAYADVIVNGKPLRISTRAHKVFTQDVVTCCIAMRIPESGPLKVVYTFGVSNKGFDMFNAEKPFTDALQARYGFNDNRIYAAEVFKVIVPKGEEFIEFEIRAME